MSDPREWIEQARRLHDPDEDEFCGKCEWNTWPCEATRALDALAAVLELHRMDTDVVHRWCVADGRTWPCPTVAAITTALGLDQDAGA